MDDDNGWFSDVLEPEEQVVWAGQPHPLRYAVTRGVSQAVLSIPLTLFPLHAWGEAQSGGISFATITAFLLITVGVAMFFSPLWHYVMARYTRYAVTDRRAIIVRALTNQTVTSFGGADMNRVDIRPQDGTWGSVHFAGDIRKRKLGWSPAPAIGFFGIADVGDVAALLRDLRERSLPDDTPA